MANELTAPVAAQGVTQPPPPVAVVPLMPAPVLGGLASFAAAPLAPPPPPSLDVPALVAVAEPQVVATVAAALPEVVRPVVTAEGQALANLLAHANKAGAKTSEFWVPFLAPLVTFSVTYVGAALMARGLIGTGGAETQLIDAGAASLTSALSALLAREYVKVRGALKGTILSKLSG